MDILSVLRHDTPLRRIAFSGAVIASSGAVAGVGTVAPLAYLGVTGFAGFAWLVTAPLYGALLVFLTLRSMTDGFADHSVAFGMNAGALAGLLAIALAVGRAGTVKRPKGVVITVLIAIGLAFHLVVGGLLLGFREEAVSEFVRSLAIVAVGFIAANSRGAVSPSRMATVIIIASAIPAILVVGEGAMRWSEVVHDGFRPRGSLSHPNAASLLFNMVMAIALWKWLYDGHRLRYLFFAGVMLLAILMTQSMGGFFQLTATLTALGMFQYRALWVRVVVAAAVVSLLAVFLFDPFGISRATELTERQIVTSSSADVQNSFEWRLVNWRLLIGEWKKEPVFGYGLGATQGAVNPLAGPNQEGLPHSVYIQLLVEGGIFGFIVFGGAGGYLAFWLYRRSRKGRNAAFAAAVLAAYLGVAFHGLATHATLNTGPMYFLAVLIGTALVVGAEDAASEEAEKAEAKHAPRRGARAHLPPQQPGAVRLPD